mmetsp:Transcript_18231/g.25735  ORF Transcript_18231/g.25735 Transcript_18231/m.25735 type:complete len:144 (+) Transcript_18231:90-521(+)
MAYNIGSYRSKSTVAAEGAYQFMKGGLYGAVWGIVTPFHAPGSANAISEAKTGIFKPAPPFSSMKSVGANAAMFASIMSVQRISSKSMEVLRYKEDILNDIFGFAVTYKYYNTFIGNTERRLVMHNRTICVGTLFAIVYTTLS